VGTGVVVLGEPGSEGLLAFGAGGKGVGVCPFVEQGAVVALDLSVCLRAVRSDQAVADAVLVEHAVEVDAFAVCECVVGKDALDLDAVVAVEADRTLEEARAAGDALVGQDLAVGQARVIIDRGMDVLEADTRAAAARLRCLAAVCAPATTIAQPSEFL
jgi:hypothetical protein